MSDRASKAHTPLSAFAWLGAGVGLLLAAWSLPVNLKSITPALLRAAGVGTPSVAQLGRQLVQSEKIGPASLVLAAAEAVRDPGTAALQAELNQLATHQPGMVAWGGWDPFLDPLFNLHGSQGRTTSTPVMSLIDSLPTGRSPLAVLCTASARLVGPWSTDDRPTK